MDEQHQEECCCCFESLSKEDHASPSCGHSDICTKCYRQLDACPICRELWFINVRLKTHLGEVYRMQWGVKETVFEIKQRFSKLIGHGPQADQMQFVWGGRVLWDDTTPHFHKMENKIMVHVVLNLRGD